METVQTSRDKGSFRFVLKKVIEQNPDYKKMVTEVMSAALNEASCLPNMKVCSCISEWLSAENERHHSGRVC